MTLTDEVVTQFLTSRRVGTAPLTITTYRRQLLRFVGRELTAPGINGFLVELGEGNGTHNYYVALRSLCNWLYREEILTSNPIVRIDPPRRNNRILPATSRSELDVLVDACDGLRDKAILRVLFCTGLRVSELARIRVKDIDWGRRRIKVMVKGGREAEAIFTPDTSALLQQLTAGMSPSESLFGLQVRGIQHVVQRVSKVAGVHSTPHTFRRGMACHLTKQGLSDRTVQEAGRWTSPAMVTRYTRSLTLDDVAESIDEAMN